MEDDVEMEFISVMGVLVPMEVTNGVSAEAKRFAQGGVPSDDEAVAADSDPVREPKNVINHLQNKGGKVDSETRAEARKSKSRKNILETKQKQNALLKQAQMDKIRADGPTAKEQPSRSETLETKTESAEAEPKPDAECFLGVMVDLPEQEQNEKREAKAKKSEVTSKPKPPTKADLNPPLVEKKKVEDHADISCTTGEIKAEDTEAEENIESRRTSTASSKVTETWKLESGDEELESKRVKKTRGSTEDSTSSKSSTGARNKGTTERRSSSEQGICTFLGCTQPADYRSKCSKHNRRSRCSLPDCTKFAHSGGKCIAHGGGARCTEDGCGRRARSKGKCYAHGGGMLCSHPGCTTRAKTKGKCIAHGGGTYCSESRCNKLVTANGKCIAHGGWVNCSHPGCNKRVQLRRKCIEHSELENVAGNVSASTESKTPAKRFRKSTNKPAEVNVQPINDKATKRPMRKSAVVDSKKPAKRAKRSAVAIDPDTKELEESMALRSGQRIKRIAQIPCEYSEDIALQMALKLSEIEY